MIRHNDSAFAISLTLLLLIIGWGPLVFGGVLPQERWLLALAGVASCALVLWRWQNPQTLFPAARPALVLALFGGWGILQSWPWPRFLAAGLAPHLVTIWDDTQKLLGDPSWGVPLSLAPQVSRVVGSDWLALALGFLAATALGERRVGRRLAALTLLAVACFQIIYGTGNWFERDARIWDFAVPGDPSRLRGTFVNPNHFAFFLALPTTACFAWLWWAWRRVRQREMPAEHRLLLLSLPLLMFILLFAGLAFSGSRGGLLAVVVAVLTQTLLLTARERRWQSGLLGLAVIVLGVSSVVLFGWQNGFGRLLTTSTYEIAWGDRFTVYAATLKLWTLFPWTGTGLGTFRQAFPLVQPAHLDKTWFHAHGDLLELLVTTGVLSLPLLAYGLFHLGRRLFWVLERGRRSEDRAAGLAALGALAAAAVHSWVDFGLTLPANAWTLTILCGLACGTPLLPAESASQTAMAIVPATAADAALVADPRADPAEQGG